ncbi:N-acetyltransferase family protein [Streptomyces altiplanensis]
MALLLPRLYFQHFTTSFLVERGSGEVAAFLVGFLSQTEPETAYVHFVGVDPALHGQGVGGALYRSFFALARSHGRRYVHCITSPENTASRAFHTRPGFTASAVKPDYDGPGLDRVAFTLDLPAEPAAISQRNDAPVHRQDPPTAVSHRHIRGRSIPRPPAPSGESELPPAAGSSPVSPRSVT